MENEKPSESGSPQKDEVVLSELQLQPSVDGNPDGHDETSVLAVAECSSEDIGLGELRRLIFGGGGGHHNILHSFLWEEMNSMANQLGYLGGPHSDPIFNALEQQNKDWEVVFEDIARMEGILAKEDFNVRDPHLLVSGRKALKNYQKVSCKFDLFMDLVKTMEKVRVQGQLMSERFNKDTLDLKDAPDSQDGNMVFPLLNQYGKIFVEVRSRTTAWADELNRRIDEYNNDFKQNNVD